MSFQELFTGTTFTGISRGTNLPADCFSPRRTQTPVGDTW